MSHYFKKSSRGFSLTELLISISIMTVIATVVLLNQSVYTESAALTNLADTLASNITQAQAYGIAVREVSPGSDDFSGSYGIALSLLSGGSNTAIVFFVDRNSDEVYSGSWACSTGGSSECLSKIDISRGNYIDAICLVDAFGSDDCSTIRRADVSFLRPNLEAQLKVFNSSGESFTDASMRGVKFVLKSPSGLERAVTVYQNGQVSVQ